jgi:hypothetical protein
MTQGVSAFGRATAPGESAYKKLSTRRDLPPRVRHLLTGLLGLCTRDLARTLGAMLNEFEQELAKQAGKARTSEQTRRCFDTLREVKRARAEVVPQFLLAIENMLARFDEHGRPGRAPTAGAGQRSDEMVLMDTGDLEQSLALQEIAMRSEVRQSLKLHDLGHRFAVLAGQPAFDADRVPLGPTQMLAALRHASASLDIPAEHRVLLYHTCDRVVLAEIGTFYEALNTFLVEHRILRHLRMHAPVRAKGKGGARTDEAPAADSTGSRAGIGAASTPGLRHQQAEAEVDAELFSTLRELLAGRHQAPGARATQIGGGFVASPDDIQAVLGKLQSHPVVPGRSGSAGQHSVTRLKQDLLAQLRPFAPAGQKPQLASEDSDTIDLVGMLFDHITKSAPASGSTLAMLDKLQVPLLRVALRDKNFFSQRSHPARLLLNAIAETGIHWIDESEGASDPALLKKMHLVIERLNKEFDGDLSLIERMLGDLSQHMQTLARKAEVAERRLVDASKGRERLALARETASNAIAVRLAASKSGRLLRTMLEQAWTDVLALTLLRQGEDSEMYRQQLDVADQLIAAGSAGRATDGPPIATLRREVEKGLSHVGYHHDEIQAVVRHLLAPEEAANDEDPISQTHIALRLKSKSHLGETASENKPAHAAALRKASLRLDAAEEKMLAHLKTLPFGTWFEFAVNQQGDRVRRKLSWYSTVTGHCLFVNQRGMRAADRSLEQLARDVVHGQANVARADESLVDRAWHAIVASLRQLTGRTADVPA